jgi:hypothetical protein
MRLRLLFVPLLLFSLARSSLAQVERPQIKNKAHAPLQINSAHCGQNEHGNYCHATLQFADTKETWDGYGLLWTVMFEDGSKSTFRQTADRSLPPSPGEKPSTPFQPREIVNEENEGYGWPTFAMKGPRGNILRLTDAEVEVEFVVNTKGMVWGDNKSPSYLQMLANRKAAKEGSQQKKPSTGAFAYGEGRPVG